MSRPCFIQKEKPSQEKTFLPARMLRKHRCRFEINSHERNDGMMLIIPQSPSLLARGRLRDWAVAPLVLRLSHGLGRRIHGVLLLLGRRWRWLLMMLLYVLGGHSLVGLGNGLIEAVLRVRVLSCRSVGGAFGRQVRGLVGDDIVLRVPSGVGQAHLGRGADEEQGEVGQRHKEIIEDEVDEPAGDTTALLLEAVVDDFDDGNEVPDDEGEGKEPHPELELLVVC
jgi:hypothetical protein